jgi:hypothetical protein
VDSRVSTLFSRGSVSRPGSLRYDLEDRVLYRRSDKRATVLELQNNSIVPPRERRYAVSSRSKWGLQSEKEIACLCFLIRITAILCLSMRRDASSQASSGLIATWGFQRNLVDIRPPNPVVVFCTSLLFSATVLFLWTPTWSSSDLSTNKNNSA